MNSPNYLPVADLTEMDGDTAPHGTLAYFPHEPVQHYALIAVDQDGVRRIMDLGGDAPFGIFKAGEGLGTAIGIPDWRIEVDPTSAVANYYDRLSMGQAFIAEGDSGIVGYFAGPGIRPIPIAVNRSGTINAASSATHRGAFTRWRIVTGPAERPVTLVDSDQLAPSAGE